MFNLNKILKFILFFIIAIIVIPTVIMPFEQYPTLSGTSHSFLFKDKDFFIWAIIITFIIFMIFFRWIYQRLSNEVQNQNINGAYRSIAIFGGFLAYLIAASLFLSMAISNLNKYHVHSPIESVETKIIYKEQVSVKSGYRWYIYFKLFDQPQSISVNEEFYKKLEPQDAIVLKIRKGRFGKYFVLEADAPKQDLHFRFGE